MVLYGAYVIYSRIVRRVLVCEFSVCRMTDFEQISSFFNSLTLSLAPSTRYCFSNAVDKLGIRTMWRNKCKDWI